jgi:hypothetical protein
LNEDSIFHCGEQFEAAVIAYIRLVLRAIVISVLRLIYLG